MLPSMVKKMLQGLAMESHAGHLFLSFTCIQVSVSFELSGKKTKQNVPFYATNAHPL